MFTGILASGRIVRVLFFVSGLTLLNSLFAQDTRTVTEPVFPPVCAVVTSQMAIIAGGPASETSPDTSRIQAALTACASGKAVELAASGGNYAFLTAPLNVPNGVSLIVDGGVTLFASRNREDYQVGTISSSQEECGTQGPNGNGCKNLITFNNGGTNANSGIYGYGVIDGRGYATTFKGGADTGISWWQNADNIPSGQSQNNPIMMKFSKSTNFTLYKITLRNSAMFHVGWSGTGFTAWGVKIQAPYTAHNTDGIDPVGSNITITNSSISNGDDQIAVGASSPSANVTISNVNLYSGHGLSVGSYTQGGLSNMMVTNVNMAGQVGDGNEDGIRLKSAADRGGLLQNLSYNNVCMRDVRHAILFTPFYNTNTGSLIPQFSSIALNNIHVLAPTGSYQNTFSIEGRDASHISTVSLNNVVFDSLTSANVSPAAQYTAFTLSGNVYPAFLQSLSGTGVTYTGSATASATPAYDCSAASIFPYEVGELFLSTATATNLQTTSVTSPASFTLNAMLQPAMSTAAYTGTVGSYAGAPAMTKPVNFLEGTNVVGTAALSANGTLASLTLSGVSAGNHIYTAQYPGDANYGVLNFGSVTVTVSQSVAAATTTALTTSAATATYGNNTTLTANVSAASGTPTGSVNFLDGTALLATVPLSGNTAATTQVLGGGSHALTAVYSGDANFATSTSTGSNVTISPVAPAMTLNATPTSLSVGASTALATNVARVSTGSTPTGTVSVLEGSTVVGMGSPDVSGNVSFTVTPAAAGTHSYTAKYSGDANYAAATSAPVSVSVAKQTPTVVLTASPTTLTSGVTTTITYTVSGLSGGPAFTGLLDIYDGTTLLASGVPVLNETDSLPAGAFITAGAHVLIAKFEGDANYTPAASAAVTVTENLDATTTTIAASGGGVYGQATTFSVNVATVGKTKPSGTVFVTDGTTSLGAITVTNGAGSLVVNLDAGSHSITAAYQGDVASSASSSAPLAVNIAKASPNSLLTASAATVNPGASVTLTAQVSGIAGGLPASGTVTFLDGTTSLGTGTLDGSGRAALVATLTTIGGHALSLQYSGDSRYASSVAQTSVAVVAPFTMTSTSLQLTLAAGQSGPAGFSITSAGGFSGTVSLSCSSPVSYVTCVIAPSTVVVNGTTVGAATATISVAATVAANRQPLERSTGVWVALLAPLGLLGFARGRKGLQKGLLIFCAFVVLAGGISGCGSGATAVAPKLPPAGTQVMTITGTSGATTGSTTVSVVITN
jgi:polygalacturonase